MGEKKLMSCAVRAIHSLLQLPRASLLFLVSLALTALSIHTASLNFLIVPLVLPKPLRSARYSVSVPYFNHNVQRPAALQQEYNSKDGHLYALPAPFSPAIQTDVDRSTQRAPAGAE